MKLLQAGDRIWMKKGLLLDGKYGPGTVVVGQSKSDDAVMFVLDGMDSDSAFCVCTRSECIRMRKERRPALRTLPVTALPEMVDGPV